MCGIAGSLSFKNSGFTITESLIKSMCEVMVHRGPDGAGVWLSSDRRIGLGHRRLSIIDLSNAASQPMCNEDGTLWVVFNGEIYNHAEVRKELEVTGKHQWKTDHSDTEVILHAFEHWGIDCLEKFRGMFAIALWDAKKRELWLIRDRIGIKPLYYSIHHGRISFASEIKALLKDPDQKRTVNEEAFFHFLSFLTTPAPQTLFGGINKLPGGTWIRVREDGQIKEHRYWEVLDHTTPLSGMAEEEITERILAELRTAVQLRKISDVPVGVFLSGGIDSSTNVALFSEGGDPVKTFTIGYQGNYSSYQNETHFARLMANEIGAEYHEKLLTIDDLIEFLPQMVRLQDEPIADPVCVPLFYVAKLARENGAIVCQVGEGADELFWGYQHWQKKLTLQRLSDLSVPFILRKAIVKSFDLFGLNKAWPYYGWPYEWMKRSSEGLPIFWGGSEKFTDAQKIKIFSSRMRKQFKQRSSWEAIAPIRERFEKKSSDKSPLNWHTYLDLNMRLPELLLMRVDKMSMGVSVECRVPFLDHKFVELVMSIPSKSRIREETSKYLLKRAVRGLIPDTIIDRPKQGFAAPINDWFEQSLGQVARKELKDFCTGSDLLDWKEVEIMLDGEKRARVWPLLNAALWWSIYIK